jgi:hypothetical protein
MRKKRFFKRKLQGGFLGVAVLVIAAMTILAEFASCNKSNSTSASGGGGTAGGSASTNEIAGEAFNLDLPLTYNVPTAFASMMGLPQLSGKSLFDETNFKNVTTETGATTVICESKGANDGTFTGVLLLSIGGKKAMRMTISLCSDSDGEFLYITEVSFKNLESGEVNSVRYDGTQDTAANLAGMFVGLLDYFYDKDKLLTR